jgi:hypothetical protein
MIDALSRNIRARLKTAYLVNVNHFLEPFKSFRKLVHLSHLKAEHALSSPSPYRKQPVPSYLEFRQDKTAKRARLSHAQAVGLRVPSVARKHPDHESQPAAEG